MKSSPVSAAADGATFIWSLRDPGHFHLAPGTLNTYGPGRTALPIVIRRRDRPHLIDDAQPPCLKIFFKIPASGLIVASLPDGATRLHSMNRSPKQNENQTDPDSGTALVASSRSDDLGGGRGHPDVRPVHLSMGDGLL
jgi:hypothetical protein